jgi:hypothetical protein
VEKPNTLFALLEAPSVIVLLLWMIVIYFSFIRVIVSASCGMASLCG